MAETIERNIGRLQQENQRKERLVENLAHEMKSPLTSIYGYAEYLMKGKVGQQEAVQRAVDSIEKAYGSIKVKEVVGVELLCITMQTEAGEEG